MRDHGVQRSVVDMAIWQFALDPIAAEKADQIFQDDDRSRELALTAKERAALFFKLSAILPPGRGWDEDMRVWGDEQRDDISFFLSDAGVEAMQIRVDVRSLSLCYIGAICALASDFGWVFISETGEIIQPVPDAILSAIGRSPANEYVRNPSGFLRRNSPDH
jgi:hypothetical protein